MYCLKKTESCLSFIDQQYNRANLYYTNQQTCISLANLLFFFIIWIIVLQLKCFKGGWWESGSGLRMEAFVLQWGCDLPRIGKLCCMWFYFFSNSSNENNNKYLFGIMQKGLLLWLHSSIIPIQVSVCFMWLWISILNPDKGQLRAFMWMKAKTNL